VPAAPKYSEREDICLLVDVVHSGGCTGFPEVCVPPGHRFIPRNAFAVAACQGSFYAQVAPAGGSAQLQLWRLVRANARGQQHQPGDVPQVAGGAVRGTVPNEENPARSGRYLRAQH